MTAEEQPFSKTRINAAAAAAKADPERLPDFLAALYPFLLWRARSVAIKNSLHDPEDLAAEALPWARRTLSTWEPGRWDFLQMVWVRSRSILSRIAQRAGRSMRRPTEFDAKTYPRFCQLDAPLRADSPHTLADTLAYEPATQSSGVLYEIPLDELSTRDRELLTAYYIEGQTWQAIADGRGRSKQCCQQQAAKALQRLRKLLDERRLRTFATAE